MRHRPRQYLAVPLCHREIRRRVLRGILPLLPCRDGAAADGHGARHRARRQAYALRRGESPDAFASRMLADPCRNLLRGMRRADDLLYDRDGLDALLRVRLHLRRAFRHGYRGHRRSFRRTHDQPEEKRPLHVHHGRRGIGHLRLRAEKWRGTRLEGSHERTLRPAAGLMLPGALPAGGEGRTEVLPHAKHGRRARNRAFRSPGRGHGTGILHAQPWCRFHHDLRQLYQPRTLPAEGISDHHPAGHRRGRALRHRDLPRLHVVRHRRLRRAATRIPFAPGRLSTTWPGRVSGARSSSSS